jgi:hypothetical protein
MVVVIRAFNGLGSGRRIAFDLLYFFFREQMTDSTLPVPDSLRRLPRFVDCHVRAVGKLQPGLRRL